MAFFNDLEKMLNSSNETEQLPYKKIANFATGEGVLYEECNLALVFLRCLRKGVRFLLSANDDAGGKFDDVVLRWSKDASPPFALFVKLMHKEVKTIRKSYLKSHNSDFSIKKYHVSYMNIKDNLDGDGYAVVLSTNADLSEDAKQMFIKCKPESVPGMDHLESGGCLYSLNKDDDYVKRSFRGEDGFVQHFYLFCNQCDSETIKSQITAELGRLLGADENYCAAVCDVLCGRVREWMNKEEVCLTSRWKIWLDIVDRYIKENVTMCNSIVTRIKYSNLEALQEYIEGCNPAWIRPPGREATALTATKVHQIIRDEAHIMLSLTRLRELEKKIWCCWGPFCRWLIIVDDNDADKHRYNILDYLWKLAGPNRRLVIVSEKGDGSFLDTCKSDDILEESWEELLKVKIMLNSEQDSCRLGDFCDTESLKAMLDENPKALAALSQISGPVRMGQDLDPLPANHICRQLTSRMRVSQDFFFSLDEEKVCIMNETSYELLSNKVAMKNTVKFEELEKYLSLSDLEWPLFVVTSKIYYSAVQMIHSKYADVRVYVLSHVGDEWLYVEEQSINLLNIVHSSNAPVIVEGYPGVGKSTMLLDMAWQLKAENTSWWILRIDLLKYSEVFESCDSGVEASENILTRVVNNEETLGILEHSLLQHCLRQYPRIVCMVDGFDEVCPDYTEKCLQTLQELTPHQGKLVVTTRPSVTGHLEAALGVSAHFLPAFRDDQLDQFHSRPLSDIGVSDNVRDLLKIPLFSRMYAESLKSGDIVEDIVSLYEAFFEMKFRRLYKEKLGDDLSKPGRRKKFQKERMKQEKQLGFLAVSHLLPAFQVPFIVQLTSEDTDDLVKAGVIYQFINYKAIFIHRTFAEHFLAKWCFSKDADSLRAAIYRKALSDNSLEFFVESFDRMASKDRPLLTAVLNYRETEVKSLLENGADAAEWDKWGRSSLHLAAAYSRDSTILRRLVGHLEAVGGSASGPAEETHGAVAKEAASEVDQEPRSTESVGVATDSCLVEASGAAGPSGVEELVGENGRSRYEEGFHAVTTALDAEDGLLQWPPLRYAAERQRWRAVPALLEVGAQFRHLGDFQRGLYSAEKLWHVFEENGYRALFEHIVGQETSGWSSQMLEHGAENERCLEIKVGVSIVCAEMSASQYSKIVSEARGFHNFMVAKLLELKHVDMGKSSASPSLELRQISSGTSQQEECRQTPHDAAGLGSSSPQWTAAAGDVARLRNAAGETLLHEAVRRGDVELVQQLIKSGADVNVQNNGGESAIHLAALADSAECIRCLHSASANVNLKNKAGKTALHFAADIGRSQSVRILLAAGAEALAQDSQCRTPLHLAARAGNVECVRLLAGAAGDLQLRDRDGHTALHWAALNGEAECVELLLAARADTNPVDNILVRTTPLHLAALRGNAECVRLLVQAGADVAARNVIGATALHWAAKSGNPDCVRFLLEARADVKEKDEDGGTPLHWAAEGGSSACIRLLLEAGADVNGRNDSGFTPLLYAAEFGDAECEKLLLEAGAEPLARD